MNPLDSRRDKMAILPHTSERQRRCSFERGDRAARAGVSKWPTQRARADAMCGLHQ